MHDGSAHACEDGQSATMTFVFQANAVKDLTQYGLSIDFGYGFQKLI